MDLSPRIERLEARIAPAFAPVIELAALDGLIGFKLSGVSLGEASGYSAGFAGDLNGDGFDDLIIGALNGERSYVVYGKRGGFAAEINLGTLDGSNGFRINGAGRSVASAGDVNGDGFPDLILGNSGADSPAIFSGAAFVVFGKAGGFSATIDLRTLNGNDGFKISGAAAYDSFGSPVSSAGDVNGDGFDDVIVGATGADPNGDRSGASYVIFGTAGGFAPNIPVGTLNGNNGFKINGVAALDFASRVSEATH